MHTKYYEYVRYILNEKDEKAIISYCVKQPWLLSFPQQHSYVLHKTVFKDMMVFGGRVSGFDKIEYYSDDKTLIKQVKEYLNNVYDFTIASTTTQYYQTSFHPTIPTQTQIKSIVGKVDPQPKTVVTITPVKEVRSKQLLHKILQYKQHLITREELLDGLTFKDGQYFEGTEPVFCQCFFGEPCKACDQDVEERENVNILLDMRIDEAVDQFVKIILYELGVNLQNKDRQKEYYTKANKLRKQLSQDVSYVVMYMITKQHKNIKTRDTLDYFIKLTLISLYKFNAVVYDLVYDVQVYGNLENYVMQHIQQYLTLKAQIQDVNIKDLMEKHWEMCQIMFKNRKASMFEEMDEALEADDDDGQGKDEEGAQALEEKFIEESSDV